MSSQLKLSILALVSSAAAIPHYGHGGHSKFHTPSGGYGQPSGALPSGTGTPIAPSGGFYPAPNSTVPYPTGTGTAGYPGELTTTIEETSTSVTTIISTIYMTSSKPAAGGDYPASSVGEEGISSAASGASCGGTVYVTATDKVTVTVTAGDAPSSSAASPSSAGEEKPSLSLPQKQPEVPSASPSEPIYSVLPVPSDKPEAENPAPEPTKEGETPAPYPEPTPEPSEGAPEPTPEPTPEPAPSSSAVESSAAPSSAAPTPSGSPSYGGGKRGLAYNDINLCQNFAGKASWAYNWASSPQGELPEGVKFVPMPWIKNEDANKWLQHVDEAIEKGTDVVMGFNEVDHPEQAAMDASTTCQRWSEYMNPIAEKHPDVTILGPSVTNAGQENWGLKWYKNFVSSCPDAVYHAANIHFYDIWEEGTLDRFKSHCEEAAKITGKKVWVTEFGLREGSVEQTTEFLKAVMEWMDGSDIVQGYAYFMVGNGANQLNDGDGLSPIGEVYTSG